VGVAWDVQGDGRLALRASYGLSYDYPTGEYLSNPAAAPPFGNRIRTTDPPGRFDDPYGHLPGGDPHPLIPGPDAEFPAGGTFASIPPDLNAPRIQSWNVTVERQLGSVWQGSVSYLGRYSDRLWGFEALNPGVFLGLGPCVLQGASLSVCTTNGNLQQRRVLSLSGENPAAARIIGLLDTYAAEGEQTYRAVRMSIQRRATSGVSFNANYTLSRCYGLEMATGAQFGITYTDPNNRDHDRGYCDSDRRHIANATVGVQTPRFDNTAMRVLLSDWSVAGIVNIRSGNPLSVLTGVDTAFNGISNQRVNQVSDDVYGDAEFDATGRIANYLNRAAFASPAPGELGNMERNSINGPGYWNGIDLALRRMLPLGSTHNLELRLEAFNLINHFSWGDPETGFNSGQFGRIVDQAGSPRIMQFGVKYGF
jgi:hypothetical protein